MNLNNFLDYFKKDNDIMSMKSVDPLLVKYFESEFGSSWKLELDKYLIKNEENNDKRVA